MLFGQTLSREQVAERTGSLLQVAGIRLSTLGDGVERGVRTLEFRTGTGLRFAVMVDRGFDIGDCEYRGHQLGWQSPTGYRHPSFTNAEEEGGLGWLRSMSGLLVTCGLDHILGPDTFEAGYYHYQPRQQVRATLHGRVAFTPASLRGYGETWHGDQCTLWCEGVVQQVAVFAENLALIRRVEADVGSSDIRIIDRVVNRGFYRTPHMYLYHINAGFPLLDEGTRYIAPVREVVWAGHDGPAYGKQDVGYEVTPGPVRNFHEQVFQHAMCASDEGVVPILLANTRLALGLEVETRLNQFPCHYQWQCFQAGHYTLGIEPATNHVLGRHFAEKRGELRWLEHGEERRYDTTLRVIDGLELLAAREARIRSIRTQPSERFPKPTGRYDDLAGPSEAAGVSTTDET